MGETERKQRHILSCLWVVALVLPVVAMFVGRYPVPLSALADLVTNQLDGTLQTILVSVRLPRILLAMLVGSAISLSGAVYQGVFQNVMASPDLLGASTGAGLGATIAILMGLGSVMITSFAFVGGLATLLLVWLVSAKARMKPTVGLILAGIMVSSLCQSLISMLKLMADPLEQLPAITYWMMGSLSGGSYDQVRFLAICLVLGGVPLFVCRWQLNALALGETQAQALGISTKKLRMVVLVCSTLLTAAAVSVSGIIGWVGLVVPHFARRLVGNNYHRLLPACVALGMTFLLCADTLARTLMTMEIPIGIVTSFVGIPFFLWLLMGRNGGGL